MTSKEKAIVMSLAALDGERVCVVYGDKARRFGALHFGADHCVYNSDEGYRRGFRVMHVWKVIVCRSDVSQIFVNMVVN